MLWNAENIALRNFQIFYRFVLRAGKCFWASLVPRRFDGFDSLMLRDARAGGHALGDIHACVTQPLSTSKRLGRGCIWAESGAFPRAQYKFIQNLQIS
jgi:hypothetical protein